MRWRAFIWTLATGVLGSPAFTQPGRWPRSAPSSPAALSSSVRPSVPLGGPVELGAGPLDEGARAGDGRATLTAPPKLEGSPASAAALASFVAATAAGLWARLRRPGVPAVRAGEAELTPAAFLTRDLESPGGATGGATGGASLYKIVERKNSRSGVESPASEEREAAVSGVIVPSKAASAPPTEPPAAVAPGPVVDIDELELRERIGQGGQSEVYCGALSATAPSTVAIKCGMKEASLAIAREAEVLSVLSGQRGFPKMLHHEECGPEMTFGALVLELLGPSLEELRESQNSIIARRHHRGSTPALLSVGRQMVRVLEKLHTAGFVHNDIKPANILRAGEDPESPQEWYLIDFGSSTRATETFGEEEKAAGAGAEAGEAADVLRHPRAPIGTPLYASVAACEASRATRPADDIESLAYTLTFLATGGRLPWAGEDNAELAAAKQQLLSEGARSSGGAAAETARLTGDVECATMAAALEALYAEVRRCHGEGGAAVDYEACLAALHV